MDEVIIVPEGSIYIWMYRMGLRQVPIQQIEKACMEAGVPIRSKDLRNYWNGWYKTGLYHNGDVFTLKRDAMHRGSSSDRFLDIGYEDYPEHPNLDKPDPPCRWVPCNADNKPMIKWGQGCMLKEDAEAMRGQRYLAENVRGCQFIVIDCDGDHGGTIDSDVVVSMLKYEHMTHMLYKPALVDGVPVSFHLTFLVDRVIPTMHFPKARLDIVGNKENSLRYLKNKVWNGRPPAAMTPEIWSEIQEYVRRRDG